MTTTTVPTTKRRPSTTARRFGYLVAVAVNAVVLWIAHQLLDWGWPGFLTAEFEDLLPLVTASLIVSMAVNAVFVVSDRGRIKPLGDLITTAFGLVVSIQTWRVFPFDFAGYGTDWTWAIRTALVLGIIGMVAAVIVNLVKLVAGNPESDATPLPRTTES